MQTLWQDLRYGVRMLLKNRGFTLIAVVTLALGIGANTAIFSVINTVLLKGLPYKETDHLVVIWEKLKQVDQVEIAPADYAAYAERSQSFAQLGATERANFNLTGVADPVRLEGQRATATLFATLGVTPWLGRVFTEEEDRTDARVAVLSYQLWQNRFAGEADIIGRNIALDGRNFTVIGVMPAAFQFPAPINNNRPSEIWTPRALPTEQARNSHNLLTVGRLKPGVTWEQARAEFENIARQRAQNEGSHPVNLIPLPQQIGRQQRPALYVLAGAVGFMLLIACANVANLLLARAASRQKEIAVRLALGARRGRIMRQLLTESLLLSLSGGVLGLLLAWWLCDVLRVWAAEQLPRAEQIAVDGWTLGFTLIVSVGTGLVFGLAPALQASRADLNAALKDGSRSATAGSGQRLRSALVVVEVALSLVLLAGAGLLIKSFWRLQQVEPGFNTRNLLSLELTLPETKYSESRQRAAFFQQTLEKFSALPGVQAAAVINSPPLSGRRNINIFPIEGRPVPQKGIDGIPLADSRIVSPDYFKMMSIPLLQGRALTEGDTEQSPKVALISQAFVNRFAAGENLLGNRLRVGGEWNTVVGIVGDIRQSGLDEEAAPHVYISYRQFSGPRTGLLLRTTVDPLSLVSAVRQQVQAIDPEQPIYNIHTMEELFASSVSQRKLNLLLLAAFALVALALAALGLYGVISYSVTQRTHEVGLRMALGAQRSDVLKLIVGQGMKLALLGVGLGLLAAVWLTRLMTKLLFEVSATDLTTYAVIASLLTLVALLACWLPARRAARVEPLAALRYE